MLSFWKIVARGPPSPPVSSISEIEDSDSGGDVSIAGTGPDPRDFYGSAFYITGCDILNVASNAKIGRR